MDAPLATTEPSPTVVHRTLAWQRPGGWWLGWTIEIAVLALASLAAAGVAMLALTNGALPLLGLWGPILLMNGLFTWSTASRLANGHVRIGADGVCVERSPLVPFARRKFVPFERLDEVGVTRNGHVELRAQGRLVAVVHEPLDPRALASAIVRARQAFRERVRADVPKAIARAGRSLHRWCDELEAHVRGGDYRESPLPLSPEVLVRVAEDPAVDAATRAVSATVATRTGTDEERIRVLAAIECTASPRLRRALAEAAEGRLDARSLARAEAEARR